MCVPFQRDVHEVIYRILELQEGNTIILKTQNWSCLHIYPWIISPILPSLITSTHITKKDSYQLGVSTSCVYRHKQLQFCIDIHICANIHDSTIKYKSQTLKRKATVMCIIHYTIQVLTLTPCVGVFFRGWPCISKVQRTSLFRMNLSVVLPKCSSKAISVTQV